jgi:hypothetical protein
MYTATLFTAILSLLSTALAQSNLNACSGPLGQQPDAIFTLFEDRGCSGKPFEFVIPGGARNLEVMLSDAATSDTFERLPNGLAGSVRLSCAQRDVEVVLGVTGLGFSDGANGLTGARDADKCLVPGIAGRSETFNWDKFVLRNL